MESKIYKWLAFLGIVSIVLSGQNPGLAIIDGAPSTSGGAGVSALPFGIYVVNAASLMPGLPSQLQDHTTLFIKSRYLTGYATVAIDVEGSLGVYSSRNGGSWNKQ